jgi:CheY-like chemotaxis protein
MAKKILVIDDDPLIVEYLVNIFRDNGYQTCTAADGTLAHEVLETERPDLITLDLEMPEEWGTRFFRRMSKDKTFSDIPVIVISGLAGRHLAIKRVVASLAKPFDPAELLSIVRRTIGPPGGDSA